MEILVDNNNKSQGNLLDMLGVYLLYNQFSLMDNYMCFKEMLEDTGLTKKFEDVDVMLNVVYRCDIGMKFQL